MKDFYVAVTTLPATLAGIIVSWQGQLEWGLRVTSLVVAIAASVAAFIYYRTKTRKIERTREPFGGE